MARKRTTDDPFSSFPLFLFFSLLDFSLALLSHRIERAIYLMSIRYKLFTVGHATAIITGDHDGDVEADDTC